MRPRKYKRPPQGTSQIVDPVREERLGEAKLQRLDAADEVRETTFRTLVRVVKTPPLTVTIPAWSPINIIRIDPVGCGLCDPVPEWLTTAEKDYRFHAHVNVGESTSAAHLHFQDYEVGGYFTPTPRPKMREFFDLPLGSWPFNEPEIDAVEDCFDWIEDRFGRRRALWLLCEFLHERTDAMAQLTPKIRFLIDVNSEELALIGRALRGAMLPTDIERAAQLQIQFLKEREGALASALASARDHVNNAETAADLRAAKEPK